MMAILVCLTVVLICISLLTNVARCFFKFLQASVSFGQLSETVGHLKLGLFVVLLSGKTHSGYKSSIKDVTSLIKDVTCTSSCSGIGIPVGNQLAINVLDYSGTLSSTPLVWMSVLLLIWYYLDYDSFGVSFEVRKC